jgi:hypothetical protein
MLPICRIYQTALAELYPTAGRRTPDQRRPHGSYESPEVQSISPVSRNSTSPEPAVSNRRRSHTSPSPLLRHFLGLGLHRSLQQSLVSLDLLWDRCRISRNRLQVIGDLHRLVQ